MRILITGANGLLGQKLSHLLDADLDVDLIATARKELAVDLKRGTFRALDVTDPEAVRSVIAAEGPDVIIHTAAMTQVDQCETEREACWKQNVTAVEHLAREASLQKAQLIHLSTDFVFDGTAGPLDESAEPEPLSYYGESKLASEIVIRKTRVRWTIIRTVLVYGVTKDQSRSNIVLWVKGNLEAGKPIQVVTDQWRTPTLAEDLAKGCASAAKQRASGVFHVSGPEMMTPYDMAVATARYFRLDESLIKPTDSNHFKQAAVRPLRTGFVIDKARAELGYEPHTFHEGLGIVAGQLHGA